MKVGPITLNPNEKEELATSHEGRNTLWRNNEEWIPPHPKPSNTSSSVSL